METILAIPQMYDPSNERYEPPYPEINEEQFSAAKHPKYQFVFDSHNLGPAFDVKRFGTETKL